MRSRFGAFAVGDADYLLATWHPSTRPSSLSRDPDVEWLRLEILGGAAGTESDDAGTVEFVAHFWDVGVRERGRLHELSTFTREAGAWFYVGAIDPPTC